MEPIDIIIIIAAVLFVGCVVGYGIWKKKKGGGCGCGCGCSGCPSAGHCSSADKEEVKENSEKENTAQKSQERSGEEYE